MKKKEKIVEVLKKAHKDITFRKRLVASPEETLKQEGVDVPSGVRIKFIDPARDTFYYILPREDQELTEEQLRKVAAGLGDLGRAKCQWHRDKDV